MTSYLEMARQARQANQAAQSLTPADNRTHILTGMARQGWCAVRSRVLDEIVILAKDEVVPIPARFRNCVVYYQTEFAELVGVPPEQLRTVHEAKRNFGGCLLPEPAVRCSNSTVWQSRSVTSQKDR